MGLTIVLSGRVVGLSFDPDDFAGPETASGSPRLCTFRPGDLYFDPE